MDIMELGAIGELVGGVAVIGTLVYMALQVRQNTRQGAATFTYMLSSEFQRMHDTTLEPDYFALMRADVERTLSERPRLRDHFDEVIAHYPTVKTMEILAPFFRRLEA